MIPWLVTLLLVANTPYTETTVDDLYIGSINPLNGKAPINARQIDVNQDQYSDLVFPTHIILQQNSTFNPTTTIDIPHAEQGPEVDFFSDTLYLKLPKTLKTYRYLENKWEVQLDLSIQWPLQPPSHVPPKEQNMPPTFERFVYDIDADGIPELIFPMRDGLHIYRFTQNTYKPSPPLRLFPETELIPLETTASTSGLARQLTFPDQHIAFHAAIENDRITILTRKNNNDATTRYTTRSYQIQYDDGFSFETLSPEIQSPVFPLHMQPCKLSPDTQIDFAGGSLDYASTLAILTPIYTTTIYTTSDEKPQTFRTKSFTPHTNFTDINNDGYDDLIQETTHITSGGLRETLNRFSTQKKFNHTVAVHLQNNHHQFSKVPDITKTVNIKLDQTPIRLSSMFQRYQAGKLLNLTGDFNKDTHNDLLVQISETDLALFLFTQDAFAHTPNHIIPIHPYETFHVIDLNQDGYSDILFQGAPDEDAEALAPARVLLFKDEEVTQ